MNLDVNWDPLLVGTEDCILKLATLCSMKILAILVSIVFVVRITLVTLEYRSVITTRYLFPLSVFCKGPDILIVTKSREPAGGNGRKFSVFLVNAAIPRARHAIGHCIVKITGHMWRVEMLSHCVLQSPLARVYCSYGVIAYMKYALPQCSFDVSLRRAICRCDL